MRRDDLVALFFVLAIALAVFTVAGCGSEDTRANLCPGTPCSVEGACYDLEDNGRTYCRNGTWEPVMDGRTCYQADGRFADCRASYAVTKQGEEPWCHWRDLGCR